MFNINNRFIIRTFFLLHTKEMIQKLVVHSYYICNIFNVKLKVY